MTLEEAVVAYLEADSGLSTLIGDGIHALKAPQKAPFPHIVYQRISTNRELTHDQTAKGLTTARIQFDVFAGDYETANDVIAALREALQGKSETMSGLKVQAVLPALEFHANEPDEDYFRLTVDYRFSFSEE